MAVIQDSLLSVGRLGATRLGCITPRCPITIAGTRVDSYVRTGSVQIRSSRGSTPSSATLRIARGGGAPTVTEGQPIVIGFGTLANPMFGGIVRRVSLVMEGGLMAQQASNLECQDETWFLDRRKVYGHWKNVAIETVVAEVLSTYAPDFTAAYVETGLGTVVDYTAVGMPVTQVLTDLANLAPGTQWFTQHPLKVYFYATAPSSITMPETVTENNTLTGSLTHSTDLSQVRTRVRVIGANTRITEDAAVGATILSVDDISAFSASGGSCITDDGQVLTYTAAEALAPPSAPSLATRTGGLCNAVGITRSSSTATATVGGGAVAVSSIFRSGATATVTIINHRYISGQTVTIAGANESEYNGAFVVTVTGANTFTITVSGTPSSPASGTITSTLHHKYSTGDLVTVSGASQSEYNGTVTITVTGVGTFTYTVAGTPASPATGTITSFVDVSGQIDPGVYLTKATFVSADGETLASSASSSVTITAVATAGAPTPSVSSSTGLLGIGTGSAGYQYKIAHQTSAGETQAGTASGTATISVVTAPGSGMAAAPAAGGSLTLLATYYYAVTFVTASGETTAFTGVQLTLTGSNQSGSLTGIPTSGDGRVTSRRIYRTTSNPVGGALGPYYLVTTIANNSATTYTDTTANASLGAIADFGTNTTGWGQISLSAIPVSSDPRVVARVIYRTAANGSVFKRLATISDNTTTTYTDNIADSSLGQDASTVDLSGGAQLRVTSIAVSSDPRVTQRKVYRTKAGGTVYFLVGTIPDNTTDYFIDNTADASLSPTVEPSRASIVGLTGIPSSSDGSITRALTKGATISITVLRNDAAAQAALAALEGGDGIHDHKIQDSSLASVSALEAVGDADLEKFGSATVSVGYQTRDRFTFAGRAVTLNFSSPISVTGVYLGQDVTISDLELVGQTRRRDLWPRRTVSAATTRFTLNDLLRQVALR